MKNISKLHYITQEIPGKPHWWLAEEACRGGVQFVQLRVKNKSFDEWLDIANITMLVCSKYDAKLIINDSVEIARACNAHGVHLGKTDIDPAEARMILGPRKIIGGTANTFDDIKMLTQKKIDYIGVGPFRFTTTKENLSPILGLEGYQQIVDQCRAENIRVPLIAIGGIKQEDVASLLQVGVHGVAIASAIALANDVKSTARDFVELIKSEDYALTNS